MCGRYSLLSSVEELALAFGFPERPNFSPRYNIAPTQDVLVVRLEEGESHLATMRWGLVPSWTKGLDFAHELINAKAETAAEKPSFRGAFNSRRCLVLADGFYEWKKEGGQKQPYRIVLKDEAPFAFAGLWERWEPPKDKPLESCVIITTAANALLKDIHNRMPVIIRPKDYDHWLKGKGGVPESYPEEDMRAYPVSKRVNNPTNDDRECIEPYSPVGMEGGAK